MIVLQHLEQKYNRLLHEPELNELVNAWYAWVMLKVC